MPRKKKCIVPGCKFEKNKEKLSVFHVPKDNIEEWQKVIRQDITLTPKHCVCEKHFSSCDILRTKEFRDSNGKLIASAAYERPQLKKGAIPSKFLPGTEKEGESIISILSESLLLNDATVSDAIDAIKDVSNPNIEGETLSAECSRKDVDHTNFENVEIENIEPPESVIDETPKSISFDDIATKVDIPLGWVKMTHLLEDTKVICFSKDECRKINNRITSVRLILITVTDKLEIGLEINGSEKCASQFGVEEALSSVETFQQFIFGIHLLNICPGSRPNFDTSNLTTRIAVQENAEIWRHVHCPLIIAPNVKQCDHCSKVCKTFNQKRYRLMKRNGNSKTHYQPLPKYQSHLYSIRKRYYNANRKNKRRMERIHELKQKVKNLESEMKVIEEKTLEAKMTDLKVGETHQETVKQILKSAKAAGNNGKRYSDDWLLSCILIHMRSPATYNYLRNLNVIPLPCTRTIRRYLSTIDSACGFDKKFLELFKLHWSKQNSEEKHGILILDEMGIRESLQVNSKNLTYKGLADFGDEEDFPSKQKKEKANIQTTKTAKSDETPELHDMTLEDKANHGLVLMFQPLSNIKAQPFAVFASHGPVNGETIAKLVVKGIILLEKCGVYVHGVTIDGGTVLRSRRQRWSFAESQILVRVGRIRKKKRACNSFSTSFE